MLVIGSADGFPEPSIPVTFETFLKRSCKAISIKQTKETKENGTYQILIKDAHYEVSTKHLKKLFNIFTTNDDDHPVTKKAKEQWGHTPRIDLLFSNNESELEVNELLAFFNMINTEPETNASKTIPSTSLNLTAVIPFIEITIRRTEMNKSQTLMQEWQLEADRQQH